MLENPSKHELYAMTEIHDEQNLLGTKITKKNWFRIKAWQENPKSLNI